MSLPGVRTAYDASAAAWRAGPEQVYTELARTLLEHTPVPLVGSAVLDVGAGTGVVSRIALRRGAGTVVALDLSAEMLRPNGTEPIPAVVGDAAALPFADRSFDLCVAALALGHLPQPELALTQMRRVAPALLVSAFELGWTHPAKRAVDEALAGFGFTPPQWYLALKSTVERQVDDPEELRRAVEAAGYRNIVVDVVRVTTGITTTEAIADWRLGMAHLAPFMSTLSVTDRVTARSAAIAAAAGCPPLVIPLVVLAAS